MTTIYLGTIDAGGRGDELLIMAINAKEGTNYSLTDFNFGDPELVTVPNPQQNTKVVLAPYAAAGHYGARTIYYNRIHSSELPTFIVPWDGERYISEILPKINNRYGIYLTTDDVNDGPVATPGAGQTNVQITVEFKPTSFVFYGTAKIQIGLNDPTGDTEVEEPFSTNLVIVANNSVEENSSVTDLSGLRNTGRQIIDYAAIAVDRFPTRVEISSPPESIFGTDARSIARRNNKWISNDVTERKLPFVGMWMDGNIARGITKAGEVYSLGADGVTWDYTGNPIGYDLSTATKIDEALSNVHIKAITQAPTGHVYLLALTPQGVPAFYRFSPGTTNLTQVTTAKVRSIVLDITHWHDYIAIDMVFAQDRIGVIIGSSYPGVIGYPSDSTTGTALPAVEIFIVGGTNTYYSLANHDVGADRYTVSSIDMVLANQDISTDYYPHIKFVTPLAGSSVLDIAMAAKGAASGTFYPVILRAQTGGGYKAEIIPNVNIGWLNYSVNYFEVSAYRISLPTSKVEKGGAPVTGAYLEVFECISPVSTTEMGGYFLKSQRRRQNGFLGYGVTVFSQVATSPTVTSGWTASSYALPGNEKPLQLVVHGFAPRQVYSVQPGYAAVRTRMTQTVGTQTFKAEQGIFISLHNAKNLKGIQGSAAGVIQPWAPVVDTATTIQLYDVVDTSGTLPAIGMSFVAQNTSGTRVWLTQPDGSNAPTIRTNTGPWRFLNTCPSLTMACEDNLLYIADNGNGSYVSTDYGRTWKEFCATNHFYTAERSDVLPANDIYGSAQLRLDQGFFKEGVYNGDEALLEVKTISSAAVTNMQTNVLSETVTFETGTLLNISKNFAGLSQQAINMQRGYPKKLTSNYVNPLAVFGPAKMLAWDSDQNFSFETIGFYTNGREANYASKHNQDNYLFGLGDVTLLDFSRDVRYLGFRHWVYVVEKEDRGAGVIVDVWKIHFTNVIAPEKTIHLFGSTEPGAYSTFKPSVNFHLWDYLDEGAGYVPYVFVDGVKVMICERINNEGEFVTNLRTLSIPSDNGGALTPVCMYNANRRDYYFYQKGNGIFRMGYDYTGEVGGSNVSLVRVANLSAAELRDLEIISGCKMGIAVRDAPQEGVIPDNLPQGTLLGWYCVEPNNTKVTRYADGSGGFTEQSVSYSADCGYVAPPTEFTNNGYGWGGDPYGESIL